MRIDQDKINPVPCFLKGEDMKDNTLSMSNLFFTASLVSVACSIGVWVFASGDAAHAERFGIFVGLWAPTLMGLANYYKE